MPSSVKIIHRFFKAETPLPPSVKIIHQMLVAKTHMPPSVKNHPSHDGSKDTHAIIRKNHPSMLETKTHMPFSRMMACASLFPTLKDDFYG
jgi:hypothetical protein